MRMISWAVAGALTVFTASLAFATTPAFEDNKLNIKGCDGAQVSVRWLDDNFILSTAGKVTGKEAASFDLVGWDGKCQSVRWDGSQAKFAIGSGEASKSSSLIRFTAVDGARWVAMRNGDGFYVARVAADGEQMTSTRVQEIAAWLERSNTPYSPGTKLANHLKTVDLD